MTAGADATASDFVLTGYTKNANPDVSIATTDTISAALGKLEKTLDSVNATADGAVQSISSSTTNTIAVGAEDSSHNVTIGLKISATQQNVTITSATDGLQATYD